MQFVPKVVYDNAGVSTACIFAIPQRFWTPGTAGRGGSDTATSGAVEAFVTRRDSIIDVVIRFHESMWPCVEAWIATVQDTGQAFDFWFDQLDDATLYSVYLHSPKMGDDVKVRRDEYKPVYEIDLTLRSAVVGTRFDVRAFA